LTRRQTLLALVGFWLLSLLAPAWCLWARLPDFWVKVVQFNPLVRLPEFLLGVTLGRLFLLREQKNDSGTPWFCGRALATSALAAIVLILSLSDRLPLLWLHNGLLGLLFALLIYGLACESCPLAQFLSAPALVVLGEASYSIYILHVPMRAWLYRVLGWLGVDVQLSWPLFVVYAALTVTVAVLVYKWLEKPAQNWLRQRFLRLPATLRPAAGNSGHHGHPSYPLPRRTAHQVPTTRGSAPARSGFVVGQFQESKKNSR
jgi:peptidoglycan/LPS O-acetylase OafA/YrhL